MEKGMRAVLADHSSMVYRLAYARTGNRMDADDVFQEVFQKLVEAAPQFRDAEHLKAWLIRATLNQCSSLWRSAWRKKTTPLRDDLASHHVRTLSVGNGGIVVACFPHYNAPVLRRKRPIFAYKQKNHHRAFQRWIIMHRNIAQFLHLHQQFPTNEDAL